MPWDEMSRLDPAFAGICFVVLGGGILVLKVFRIISAAQKTYLEHITAVSATCHASHEAIEQRTSIALDKVTSAVTKLTDRETQNEKLLAELIVYLRRINGRP